jgi:hypothetical protein
MKKRTGSERAVGKKKIEINSRDKVRRGLICREAPDLMPQGHCIM